MTPPQVSADSAIPRRILLATDLSSRCDRAQDRAVRLAQAWGAKLSILHVIPGEVPADRPSWRREDGGGRAMVEAQIRADLEGSGLDPEVLLARGDPAETILHQAGALGAGLLVTGVARDEMLGRASLGAIVDRLVSHAPMPVLVVKGRAQRSYREILVATDFSAASRHALETALRLFPEARITLFHSYQVPFEGFISRGANQEEMRQMALAEQATFLDGVRAAPGWQERVTPLLEHGEVSGLVCDYVRERGVGLAVLGTQGRSGLAGFLVGSTAKRLLAALPCDTMTVRQSS
ncbi:MULTISPECIES: universal stress protein [Roseomonadaceae]|uniref:Universal stress protein n=1 Tax=Falsiroseomonas oleicola TaxID=2801474 RepID=A0ABS6H4T9_9PROT|nr:universal stress protein [Roseomonas oleicola]MBU8543693.1 universal stress protein [Roseomonas oleicola]